MALPGKNGTALAEARSYADRVLHYLSCIAESLRTDESKSQLRYLRKNANAAAGGTGIVDFEFATPPGILWIIERLTTVGSGVGPITAYLNEVQPTNVIGRWTPDAGGFADSDEVKLYVPDGNKIIVRHEGLGANQLATVVLRAREHTAGEESIV